MGRTGEKSREEKKSNAKKFNPRASANESKAEVLESNESLPSPELKQHQSGNTINMKKQAGTGPAVGTQHHFVHQHPKSANIDGLPSAHEPHLHAGFSAQHGTYRGPAANQTEDKL